MVSWRDAFEKSDVLYEDNHLIAINKKAGQLSQPDETEEPDLGEYVKDYIAKKYKKPGAVFLSSLHRLDQPVTGVMLFGRTSKGTERMEKLFKERAIEKYYWAITKERPKMESDHLKHYIYQLPGHNIMKTDRKQNKKGGKWAELEYEMLARIDGYNLIRVKLLTGRKHQIRLQLSAIGAPILGDLKYGYHDRNHDRSICLHAASLAFEHPIKKERIVIKAPEPKMHWWRPFKSMIAEY